MVELSIPTAEAFREELVVRLSNAARTSKTFVDVNSGNLHRAVGSYPGVAHRMPTCCAVIKAEMQVGDEIISIPSKGRGANFTVRFKLPR